MKNEVNLTKFPFKSMISIVDAIYNSKYEIDLYEIQKASKACIPDTYEVLEMIRFLICFGKIVQTKNEWTRSNQVKKINPKPIRAFYLNTLLKIIHNLSETPKTEIEISKNTQLNTKSVLVALKFLEKITNYGIINKIGNADQYRWFIGEIPKKGLISTY